MRIIVTGGAGFIGSHMVACLWEANHYPITIDNLSNGHRDAVLAGDFHCMDIRDTEAISKIMLKEKIDAVIHFASFIENANSFTNPLDFYENNIGGTISILKGMARAKVPLLVFSSSASVYGSPLASPVTEDAILQLLSPYGHSKLAAEYIINDTCHAYGIRAVRLRYFNAAGNDPKGRLKERHQPETHLIPLAISAAKGYAPALKIFGNDYPTPDGTCIRDYVHVSDLTVAHLLSLNYLKDGGSSEVFNLGIGRGYSVKEVLEIVANAVGRAVPYVIGQRRSGDPAELVADTTKAELVLGWKPSFRNLQDIVNTAVIAL